MSKENPTPQQPEPDEKPTDHTVELIVRFTIPAAFTAADVNQLAAFLVEHVSDVGQGVWDDFGPYALRARDGAYISAVLAQCWVVGRRNQGHSHRRHVAWGHGNRCRCHHPGDDHECPDVLDGPPGRCFVNGCDCGQYARLSREA